MKRWSVRSHPWLYAGLGVAVAALLGLLAYLYLRPPPVPEFVLDGHSFIPVSPTTRNGTLVVLYSGDGGWWGDLDRQMAERLGRAGFAVVGVDTNVYFNEALAPERVGDDLNHLILDLTRRWHAPKVVLIGYSFGADILPLAYNRMSKSAQRKVLLMGLLALGKTSPLRVTLAEQTGLDTAGPPVAPEIAKIAASKILCIYGKDETKDTGCLLPPLKKADILATEGSHHFDHQYDLLEQSLRDAIKRRSTLGWRLQHLG